jgi:hypothetical protein
MHFSEPLWGAGRSSLWLPSEVRCAENFVATELPAGSAVMVQVEIRELPNAKDVPAVQGRNREC